MSFYSNPIRGITDCGTGLTSKKFKDFLNANRIEHVKTAIRTPQGNSQVERINKTLTPMLAKLCSETNYKWDKLLPKNEFAFNNTFNKSISYYPSVPLLGQLQTSSGNENSNLDTFVRNRHSSSEMLNIVEIRSKAQQNNLKMQKYYEKCLIKSEQEHTTTKKGILLY